MVIWLFAGGGESELKGLVLFLQNNFPEYSFKRYTPMKIKKAPKANKKNKKYALGQTGKSLGLQISEILPNALADESCDLILVLDDLDCRNQEIQRKMFSDIIMSVSDSKDINHFIAFAAPEIEAWIIADWDNTFAKDINFRYFHEGLRHRLSCDYNVLFADPESFSEYDENKKSCKEKLSEIIIDAVFAESLRLNKSLPDYSKKNHTPELLIKANARVIAGKCPIFNAMYQCLKDLRD